MSIEREATVVDKNVLVVGDVTCDQYQPARLHILRSGHKPKVKRVAFDDLYLERIELVEKYASDDEKAADRQNSAEDDDGLEGRLAARHLETFGLIGAVVLSESDWRLTSDSDFIWVASALRVYPADEFHHWIVHPDGQVELA